MMCRPDFTHSIFAETVEPAERSSAPIAQKQHLASAVDFQKRNARFLPAGHSRPATAATMFNRRRRCARSNNFLALMGLTVFALEIGHSQ
jgi:hypothetical protein